MNEPPAGDVSRGPSSSADPRIEACLKRYWRANITLMSVLLACWAVVGLGCGVLFADTLNQYKVFGGFPLGFWFAQQGSIIGFVLIIFVYAVGMNGLDKKHHKELTGLRGGGNKTGKIGGDPGQGPAGHDRASGEVGNGLGGDSGGESEGSSGDISGGAK